MKMDKNWDISLIRKAIILSQKMVKFIRKNTTDLL